MKELLKELNEDSKKYSRFIVELINKRLLSPKEVAYIGAALLASGHFVINKEEIACIKTILSTSDMGTCALILDSVTESPDSPINILQSMIIDCLTLDRGIYEK